MAQESTGLIGCLSAFFTSSRSKALASPSSSNISTLVVRSWGALLLGVICACVTCFVLFDDVLRSGAKFTTDHALTLAVILIVAAAAHMWWQQTRNGHVVLGLGLVCLFFAGLAYLVVASGGRNAEVMIAKRNAAHASNSERTDRLQKIAEAEFILGPCPIGTPKKDIGERCGLRAVMTAECASGKGTKCDGKSYSVSTYEAAIEGHRAALAKLPELEENGAIRSAARVLVAFKGLPSDEREAAEKDYAGRLELLLPYIKAVLVEVATIVFLAVAVGHGKSQRTVPHSPSSAPVRPNHARKARRYTKDEAAADLVTRLALGERFGSQDELAERYCVAKSTMSDWLKDFEGKGLILSRQRTGRCKLVSK